MLFAPVNMRKRCYDVEDSSFVQTGCAAEAKRYRAESNPTPFELSWAQIKSMGWNDSACAASSLASSFSPHSSSSSSASFSSPASSSASFSSPASSSSSSSPISLLPPTPSLSAIPASPPLHSSLTASHHAEMAAKTSVANVPCTAQFSGDTAESSEHSLVSSFSSFGLGKRSISTLDYDDFSDNETESCSFQLQKRPCTEYDSNSVVNYESGIKHFPPIDDDSLCRHVEALCMSTSSQSCALEKESYCNYAPTLMDQLSKSKYCDPVPLLTGCVKRPLSVTSLLVKTHGRSPSSGVRITLLRDDGTEEELEAAKPSEPSAVELNRAVIPFASCRFRPFALNEHNASVVCDQTYEDEMSDSNFVPTRTEDRFVFIG